LDSKKKKDAAKAAKQAQEVAAAELAKAS